MKFHIDTNHRDFFNKQHFIEFEGLLTEAQLRTLQEQTSACFKEPQKKAQQMDPALAEERAFLSGRDLWRKHQELKKVAAKRDFGEIAAELTGVAPIRLCYDQYLPGLSVDSAVSPKNVYLSFLKKGLSLEHLSCVQGVVCGALICLENNEEAVEGAAPTLFSRKAGNVVFFNAAQPLDLAPLITSPGARYWMLVFGRVNAVYIHQENDPNGHFLKGLGYAYGDKLLDRSHPILYR